MGDLSGRRPGLRGDAAEERRLQELLAREADRISRLILSSDLPEIDLDVAIETLRSWAEETFPGREDLFERIYGARFRRLREQFPRPARAEDDDPFDRPGEWGAPD